MNVASSPPQGHRNAPDETYRRAASTPARCCDEGGHSNTESTVVSYFDVYRCAAEAIFDIPALSDGDPPLQIRIAAAGGGTVGHAYANNDWIYDVRLAGTLVRSGADLHSGATPRTHRHMAVLLAEGLSAPNHTPPRLYHHNERLTLWASDAERPERGGQRHV